MPEGACPERKQRRRFFRPRLRVRRDDLQLQVHHLLEQIELRLKKELRLPERVLHRRLRRRRARRKGVAGRQARQGRLKPRPDFALGHDATPISGSKRGAQFSTLEPPAGGDTSFSTLPNGGIFEKRSGWNVCASISIPSTTRGPGRLK